MEYLELTRIDHVDAHETLRDYDELPEAAKDAIPTLVGRDSRADEAAVVTALDHGTVIKFTDYFRVETG